MLPQAFTDHYYNTFDTNRAGLAGLYQDQSLLSFEGQKFQGTQQVNRHATQVSNMSVGGEASTHAAGGKLARRAWQLVLG